MNETTIIVVFPTPTTEHPDGQHAMSSSTNPCVITAQLTALLMKFPRASIKEEAVRVSNTTSMSWGKFRTVITLTVLELPR